MKANIENPPRVYLSATEDTATSVVDLDIKPERRCDMTIEDGAVAMTIARNVPWAQAHIFKQALEGMLEIAISLQADPPPRES